MLIDRFGSASLVLLREVQPEEQVSLSGSGGLGVDELADFVRQVLVHRIHDHARPRGTAERSISKEHLRTLVGVGVERGAPLHAESSRPVLRRGIVSGRGVRHAPFCQPGVFELSGDVGRLCFGRPRGARAGGPGTHSLTAFIIRAPPRVRGRLAGRWGRRRGLLGPHVAPGSVPARRGD